MFRKKSFRQALWCGQTFPWHTSWRWK